MPKLTDKPALIAAALAGALTFTAASAQTPPADGPPTPGFNTKIPDQILTPDSVDTRIGTLNFVDGVPTVETTQKVYDNLDFLRGVEVFLDFIPVGNATARAIGFRNRDPRSALFENSQWKSGFIGSDYRWIDIDGVSGRALDARTNFFYLATVNIPAMSAKLPGRGSQYAMSYADSLGDPFDGAKAYRVTIPKDVPAKDFWSVVVYDPQTRSELQTGQPFPSRNNKRDKLAVNEDGSSISTSGQRRRGQRG